MKLRRFLTELAETFTAALLDRDRYFLYVRAQLANVKVCKHDKS